MTSGVSFRPPVPGEGRHMTGNLLIRGGDVVDGSGAPARRADVRVRDGRIDEIAPDLRPDGEPQVDASGAVVTPGFIDTHAHTDPQVFWDPLLDPEPLHGVTTMLVGNCSLSLYPVNDSTRDVVADLFAYIEDVPRHLFDDCVPWSWSDYAGYRDAVNEMGTGVNLAALVGHSPLRLAVMGEAAWTEAADEAQTQRMAQLLDRAIADGAWGLSTSFLDVDKDGRDVPSRAATTEEFAALFDAVARHRRGVIEMVPGLLQPSPEVRLAELSRLAGERGLPLTWTGFTYSDSNPAATQKWIDLARELAAEGARMYPQISPRTVDFRLNWDSSMMFMSMPEGWHRVIAARGAEAKRALLADEVWRTAARDEWDRTTRALFPHNRPETVRFVEVHGAGNAVWLGRTLADLIAARGGHPSDVLADFVVANLDGGGPLGLVAVGVANSDVDGVARIMNDPSVIISSSDAGAHAQMLCASGDTTLVLTRHVRERGDMTLERAVHELTGRQAEIFGFRDRGRIEVGAVGDLCVFALDELHYDADTFVHDLPGNGARLRREGGGYRATVVGGVPVQLGGSLTGMRPGGVLHSAG